MIVIPCTNLATVADLRRGQWAALFSDSTAMQRILSCEPHHPGSHRVAWDFGPGTRGHVRIMPSDNPVQIRWY